MSNITNDNQSLTVYSNKTDRELLIENVKNWTLLDEKLRIINEKTKHIREMKTKLTRDIHSYMKTNNITTNIGISDGELRVFYRKDYQPLTFYYIEKCLSEIINDKSHVEFIIKYLKEKREISTTPDIKRISTKL